MVYKINFIYGIGIRCYTSIILKRLNLHPFSSIFGSLYIKNFNNLIKCFNTKFDILFNKNNLIFTKNYQKWINENNKYGNRTINKVFDNINDYHSSTIPHHDLSLKKDLKHFERGIKRLEYIKKIKKLILFINISHSSEFNNSIYNINLLNSIKKYGFENFFIICIYKNENIKEDKPLIIVNNYYIYEIKSFGYNDPRDDLKIHNLIKQKFNINLISKNIIDNEIKFSN